MIQLLKALIHWCDIVTALVIYSEDLSPHDRAKVKLALAELKDAAGELRKSDNA